MLSESSSISFSQSLICISICLIRDLSKARSSMIFSSRSNNFIAYHLRFSLFTYGDIDSSICAIACSTLPLNTCGGSLVLLFLAASMACSARYIPPLPFIALIGTILHPSCSLSSTVSIMSPFLRTKSIMLSAITTGILSSSTCVVRYRFLSRFVPSIMFIITSGFSFTR